LSITVALALRAVSLLQRSRGLLFSVLPPRLSLTCTQYKTQVLSCVESLDADDIPLQYWQKHQWVESMVSVLGQLKTHCRRLKSLTGFIEHMHALDNCVSEISDSLAEVILGTPKTLERLVVPWTKSISNAVSASVHSMTRLAEIRLNCQIWDLDGICDALDRFEGFKHLRKFEIYVQTTQFKPIERYGEKILGLICVPTIESIELIGIQLPHPSSWSLPKCCNKLRDLKIDFPAWITAEEGSEIAFWEDLALEAIDTLSQQLSASILCNLTFSMRVRDGGPIDDGERVKQSTFLELVSEIRSFKVTNAILGRIQPEVVLDLSTSSVPNTLPIGSTRYRLPSCVIYDGRIFTTFSVSPTVFVHRDKLFSWYYIRTFTGYTVLQYAPGDGSMTCEPVPSLDENSTSDDTRFGVFQADSQFVRITHDSFFFVKTKDSFVTTWISDSAFWFYRGKQLWYFFWSGSKYYGIKSNAQHLYNVPLGENTT
jgi:hypothetical protein